MSVRKNTLDGLFSGIEDITDARGKVVNTVLYSKAGNYSSIFEIENPVQQYSEAGCLLPTGFPS